MRIRIVKLWPYAAAVGILIVCLALFVALEWQAARDLGVRAVALVQAKWHALAVVGFTLLVVVTELVFVRWERTTVFRLFVQRSKSATVNVGFTLLNFSGYKWVADYVFTLGAAYGAARLGDAVASRAGWMRWEPSDSWLQLTAAFVVYFLISTFVGYWQHRLMHWRAFWNLHRFHHSDPDFNVFTGFRANPAETISSLIPALSPLIFLKLPDAGLFVGFVLVTQAINSFQHSELPWDYGWVGRWIIAAPRNHQIHHSIDQEHRDRNFSDCPLWDHLFGTWYGGPNRPSAYGIPDPAHVERPATQWLIDIWTFYRDVTLGLTRLVRRTGRVSPEA